MSDLPRRVYKAAHRKLEPGDMTLTTRAITGEVVEPAEVEPVAALPPDVERLWIVVAETGLTVAQAARRIGMSEERARQIARTRLWADAMRHGLAQAGVTPVTVGKLIADAMNATYPKSVKNAKGKREVQWVANWGARTAAIKAYLHLNLELAKIERLPDGQEDAAPTVRRQLVATGEVAGKTREQVLQMLAERSGARRG